MLDGGPPDWWVDTMVLWLQESSLALWTWNPSTSFWTTQAGRAGGRKKILKYLGTESNHHLALTKHADVVYKKGPTADITPEEAEKF